MTNVARIIGQAIWGRFRHRPWLLALVMTAPIPLFDAATHFFSLWTLPAWPSLPWHVSELIQMALLFSAGGLARQRFRQAAAMAVLGMLTWAALEQYGRLEIGLPFPYPWLIGHAFLLAALVGGDLAARRCWRAMRWGALTAFIAAALMTSIAVWGWLDAWRLSYGGASVEAMGVFGYPLLSVIGWPATGAAQALQRAPRVWPRAIAVVAVAAAAGFSAIAPPRIIIPLAERSLKGEGPFAQHIGANILAWRGNDADVQLLWQVLLDGPRPDVTQQGPPGPQYLIHCLRMHVPDEQIAQRLTDRLMAAPDRELAGIAAEILGQQRRYEAAVVLFRYGLLGSWPCEKALVAMDVPQVAYILIYSHYDRIRPGPWAFLPRVERTRRQQLAKILGRDVGNDRTTWLAYYRQAADTIPSPLTARQRFEIEQLIDAFDVYWSAEMRLRETAALLTATNLPTELAGLSTEQLTHEHRDQLLTRFLSQFEALRPPPPNWDAPTTDDLVRSIDQYAALTAKVCDAAAE